MQPKYCLYEVEKGYSNIPFKLREERKLMAQINKILVAFDGSKHGLKALDYAKKLTIDNHALLTVLYVHDDIYEKRMNVSKTSTGDEFIQNAPGPLVDNDPITPVEERYVTIDQIPFQITSIAKEKLIDLNNVIFERLVGRPAEEIVDYATEALVRLKSLLQEVLVTK